MRNQSCGGEFADHLRQDSHLIFAALIIAGLESKAFPHIAERLGTIELVGALMDMIMTVVAAFIILQ